MRARRILKWSALHIAFAAAAFWLSTCNLNPQPLPPRGDNGFASGEEDAATQGPASSGTGGSSGSSATSPGGNSSGSSSGFGDVDATALDDASTAVGDGGIGPSVQDGGGATDGAADGGAVDAAADAAEVGADTGSDAATD